MYIKHLTGANKMNPDNESIQTFLFYLMLALIIASIVIVGLLETPH